MDAAEYLERVKMKKRDKVLNDRFNTYNFPNNVTGAKMTGSVYIQYVSEDDYSKTVEEINIDPTLLADLQRVTFPPQSIPYEPGDEGIFYITHFPAKPWNVNSGGGNGLAWPPVTLAGNPDYYVGSGSLKFYSRAEPEDPFTLDSTWPVDFYGYLLLLFSGGGHPVSGGRGADSNEKRMGITVALNVLGVDAEDPNFTLYEYSFGGDVPTADSPYPWDDPWPGYTDIFTDSFNDILADAYGDTTGSSCDLAFEWLY
jgi:hypothetical protein